MQEINSQFSTGTTEQAQSADLHSANLDGGDVFGSPPVTDCAYQNVATCPDCGAGMLRLGGCCACLGCGFESCSV